MRRLVVLFLLIAAVVGSTALFAAEYRLNNGEVLRGEASSFTDDGLVVRLTVGGFSPRIPWGKLTQETLKELAQRPEAKEFVEPYIEIPPDVIEQEKEKEKEIIVKDPPRVQLVEGKTGFFASLANPIGFFILGALYLANLYAALEVARWKGRPVAVVVGLSAIAPLIGPLLFSLLPGTTAAPLEHVDTAPAPADQAPINPMAHAGAPQSALGLAGGGQSKAVANPAYSQVYSKSNTTFDRRFFETKFSGFFRVVPADAEKDLVIAVKTPKNEYRANRVSRISASEVHLQTQSGAEVGVPFGEIMEVSVKPKGAK